MIIENYIPFLAVIIPLLSAIVIPYIDDDNGNKFTSAICFVSFLLTLTMYSGIKEGAAYLTNIDTGLMITFLFRVDALSFIVGLIASLIWGLSSLFAVEYMKKEKSLKRYNIFSLLSFSGMMGVVFTGNLFTLYIFFELLSVASYVMFIHKGTKEARDAGLTYIFMGVIGGLILLFSIIATYAITGTGDLSKVGMGLADHPAMPFIFIGYIIGFGVKAGIFPMHIWMPRAYPNAPTVAASISSGAMIKAGAYGIIRTLVSIVGFDGMKDDGMLISLVIFAFFNIILGSAAAIRQVELKKMLAYSSVAQIGYIILGVSLLSPMGFTGGVLHIFNHALTKGALFLCAAAYIHKTGKIHIEDFKGIGKKMPLTTICFTIAALSMIGFPPFPGFISKWYLANGALEVATSGANNAGIGMIAMFILLLSSFMNLLYYGPVVYRAWFKDSGLSVSADNTAAEAPNYYITVPLLTLGIAIIAFGIFPQFPISLAQLVTNLYIQ